MLGVGDLLLEVCLFFYQRLFCILIIYFSSKQSRWASFAWVCFLGIRAFQKMAPAYYLRT